VNGLGVVVAVAAAMWLTHALATSPLPHPAPWDPNTLQADGRFSEASLQRFADTFEPGALALAQRYAPLQKAVLPKVSAAPSELSYDSDPGPLPQGFQDLTPEQAAAANSAVPFSKAPNPAAAGFKLPVTDTVSRTRALDCLTMAIYYEAASESGEGQAAVAQVVLNRLRNPLFPKTVCGVVFEGSKLSTGCQFSFTCDGSLARRPSDAGWKRARDVATRALNGYVLKSVGEATHYHTMWVVPYWQPSVVKLTQIGAHIFYRWQGTLGLPGAFRMQYAGVEEQPPTIPGFVDNPAAPAPTLVAAAAPAAAEPIAAPVVKLADLAQPKAAPVVLMDAAPAQPIQPVSVFGQARRPMGRPPMAGGW
jgi:spore germination cell wall hydrolase CwlJ-like protein